ncbi:MAG TPA: hypothetical protein VGS02_05020 [Acidobacteriaceae bacterium]|nr:hypothetical protein [Acidobacteriaceae bacterium]
MQGDQRMVLQLIALGRLSPAEAERLLLASSAGRETAWMVGGCVLLAVIGLLQAHAGALLQIGHAVSLASQVLGRVL